MTRVLLTAFEPFGPWSTNASWLTLQQVTRELPASPQITTRRYPVDFAALPALLQRDLGANYDAALFLGQAAGRSVVELESIGLNLARDCEEGSADSRPLVTDGPVAYRSELPLEAWAAGLTAAGIPAQVSFHAGTYLCNAALYMAHYLIERLALQTRAAFIHVPLDLSQVTAAPTPAPSMPVEISAAAVQWMLGQFAAPPLA